MESKEMKKTDYKRILDKLDEDLLSDDIIKDNKLHFMHEKELYCVSMPKQKILTQANIFKNQKYVELIQKENTITEKKLIKILKEHQDIDIEEMQKEIKKYQRDLQDAYLRLYEKRDAQEEKIASIEKEIDEIKRKHADLSFEIAEHLSPCIETQVKNYYMEFLTANCTEKYVEEVKDGKRVGDYVKVWDSYEDYEETNSELRYEAIGYLTHLMMNVRG